MERASRSQQMLSGKQAQRWQVRDPSSRETKEGQIVNLPNYKRLPLTITKILVKPNKMLRVPRPDVVHNWTSFEYFLKFTGDDLVSFCYRLEHRSLKWGQACEVICERGDGLNQELTSSTVLSGTRERREDITRAGPRQGGNQALSSRSGCGGVGGCWGRLCGLVKYAT